MMFGHTTNDSTTEAATTRGVVAIMVNGVPYYYGHALRKSWLGKFGGANANANRRIFVRSFRMLLLAIKDSKKLIFRNTIFVLIEIELFVSELELGTHCVVEMEAQQTILKHPTSKMDR